MQSTTIRSRTGVRRVGVLAVMICVFWQSPGEAKPLRVYILAGQSNMQGSAHKSTFAAMKDDTDTLDWLDLILDQDGEPRVSDNAWIKYRTSNRDGERVLQGKVQVGYGFDGDRIGPEYAFGMFVDQATDEPILLIKTAWGGKSLAVDFRPPSAGPYQPSEQERLNGRVPSSEDVGHYYREMIQFVRQTLEDEDSISALVPTYDAEQGYQLAGFVWFQGWNDLVNRKHTQEYTDNMIHFITDVRNEFDVPTLPFIVGVLGVYGTDPDSRRFDKSLPVSRFREMQFAAVETYDQSAPAANRGNVVAVDSGPYYELALSDIYWKRRLTGNWKRQVQQGKMSAEKYKQECQKYGFGDGELTSEEQRTWDRCASNAEYHYLGSGKTFIRFGKALAEAMLEMN
ncbi:MAG: sialate O-acetylesterase [Planctomycetota bacterium]